MKFYQKKYILYLLLILISLIYKSIQNEQEKLERIEDTIKLILLKMKGQLNITEFSFKYNKYSIAFNNIRLLKPLNNNINIYQEKNKENEIFYVLKSININFIIDLNIKLLSNPNSIVTDESLGVQCNYNEIKFKLIDDYNIELHSCDMNNFYMSKSNKILGLDFFKDFNNGKNCTFIDGENEPLIIEDITVKLKEMFNQILKDRIKEIEKNNNLLFYDMMKILNNITKVFEKEENEYVNLFELYNIATKDNYINFNKEDNSIKISNFTISGDYYEANVYYIYFYFFCGDNKNHFIYKKNKENKYFDIFLDDCEFFAENYYGFVDENVEKKEIINGITIDFKDLLNKKAEEYYKNTLEIE